MDFYLSNELESSSRRGSNKSLKSKKAKKRTKKEVQEESFIETPKETDINVEDGVANTSNGHVVDMAETKVDPVAPLSSPYLPKANGYQSNMKRLLTMPEMHSEPGPSTERPMSAFFISNSR